MKSRNHVILSFLALFSQLLSGAAADQKECTVHDCMNSYDLNPLRSDDDYIITTHTRNITLNLCRNVHSEPWNIGEEDPKEVGAFTRGAHGDISMGKYNTTLHVRDGHPVMLLLDGSKCPRSESMRASTAIRFICDRKAGNGSPQLVAQLPPEDDDACAFFIEWRTRHACGIPDGKPLWKILVTSIVIILALLLTLGALLLMHRLLRRRRNSNLPPQLDEHQTRWFDIAGNARELGRLLRGQDPWGHPNGNGVEGGSGRRWGWKPRFNVNPFGRRGRGRDGFSRLPRNAEEESMMRNGEGGRLSFEDDDEHMGNGHGNGGVPDDTYAEESAAWNAQRARGIDGNGVIRL